MRRVPAVLLTAGLLLPAACGPDVDSALGQRPSTYPAAGSQQAPAATGSLESELVARTTSAVEAALSYDHASYAADTARAEGFMTRSFAARWADVARRLRPHSDARKAGVSARVVAGGVSGATTQRAQVLLFVDRTVTSVAGTSRAGGYAIASLRHQGGEWLLSGLSLDLPRHQIPEQRPVPATVLAAAGAVADSWEDLSSAHPHADVARVVSLTTGPFRASYERAAPEMVARVVGARAEQSGRSLATALTSLKGGTAHVLAAVESTLTVPGSAPTRRLVRIEMTMVRTRTAWLAREIRVIPSP